MLSIIKVPTYSRCTSVCFNVLSAKEYSVFWGEKFDYNSFRLFFRTCFGRGKAIGDFLFFETIMVCCWMAPDTNLPIEMRIRSRGGSVGKSGWRKGETNPAEKLKRTRTPAFGRESRGRGSVLSGGKPPRIAGIQRTIRQRNRSRVALDAAVPGRG